MAKRMTDSEKWKKLFFRELKPDYKLLWLYIWDDCNHAGIWEKDFDIARIRLGMNVTEEEALHQYRDAVREISNGEKWFIPSFVEFQYTSILNPENSVHRSVLKSFIEHKIDTQKWLDGNELPW